MFDNIVSESWEERWCLGLFEKVRGKECFELFTSTFFSGPTWNISVYTVKCTETEKRVLKQPGGGAEWTMWRFCNPDRKKERTKEENKKFDCDTIDVPVTKNGLALQVQNVKKKFELRERKKVTKAQQDHPEVIVSKMFISNSQRSMIK